MKKIYILSPQQLRLVSGGEDKQAPTYGLGPYPPESYPTGSKKIGNFNFTPTASGNSFGAGGLLKVDYPLTKNLDVTAGIGFTTNYHNLPQISGGGIGFSFKY